MCGAPLDDCGSVDVFFMYDMVLVLWGVGPILGNGMEYTDRIVTLRQGSEMSAGLHSSNFMLGN